MDTLCRRGIELAVHHTGACAHPLNVTGPDHRAGAETVLVLERTIDDAGDDLHVSVAVSAEALAGRDAVLVDDSQNAKSHLPGVVILPERERVETVEPVEPAPAAFPALPDLEHNPQSTRSPASHHPE